MKAAVEKIAVVLRFFSSRVLNAMPGLDHRAACLLGSSFTLRATQAIGIKTKNHKYLRRQKDCRASLRQSSAGLYDSPCWLTADSSKVISAL